MPRRTPTPRTILRKLQKPSLSLLLAFLLFVDAHIVANPDAAPDDPWPRRITRTIGTPVETASRTEPELFIVLENGNDRVIDTDTQSWDELARHYQHAPERIAIARYSATATHRGLWAKTRQTIHESADIEPFEPRAFDEQAHQTALEALDAHLERDDMRWWPGWNRVKPTDDPLKTGQTVHKSIRLFGYLHNAASLAILASFILSLGWLVRLPADTRAALDRRSLRRGRCPRCGYDISKLENPPCPECGASWNHDAAKPTQPT